MKALLDEQLSPRIAELLRDRGHDVQAVADRRDLAGRSDRVTFAIASIEERAVVTSNVKDFRPLAAECLARGESHPGLILLPSTRTRTRSAVESIATAIEQIFRDHPDGLHSTEHWIPPRSAGSIANGRSHPPNATGVRKTRNAAHADAKVLPPASAFDP